MSIIFVMLLPFNIPKTQLLLLGFATGFVIDLFMGTPGLHAGATTFIAFCRPSIIKLVSGSQKFENIQYPNLNQINGLWFLRYTSSMVIVHHLTLFLLETFSFRLLGQTLLRTLLSAPVSIFLIMLMLYFFKSGKQKD